MAANLPHESLHPDDRAGAGSHGVGPRRVGSALLLALICVSCAKVEPGPDYERARQLITERTGSESVYDPRADELVAERVAALLADGLTVDEAVQVALLNNHPLQTAFLDIGVSRAEVVQSGLMTNPSIGLLNRFPEGGGRSALTFTAGQQLVDLWQIPVRREIARARLEETILDVAGRAFTLAADVRVRSYQLIALQRAEEETRQSLTLANRSLELARHQFEAGAVSQVDVNLARTNAVDIQLELITLRRERQVAESELLRLLDLRTPQKDLRLTDALPGPRAIPDDLLQRAVDQRLDIRIAESQVRGAEARLREQVLKVFPSVEVGFEVERSERQSLPGRKILADAARDSIAAGALTAPSIESRAQRRLERRQIIDAILGPSIAITLPVFDQNQAQIATARLHALRQRMTYEDSIDRVLNEVSHALAVAENAGQMVQFFSEEALPHATQSVELARRVYEAGEQSILVLIQAQESYTTRRRAYIRALGEYAVALAELERAIGGRLDAPATASAPATEPAP